MIVGGGLGRTPMIGKVVREFLPKPDLLAYLEAIMRVYNLEGRRDNKFKARVRSWCTRSARRNSADASSRSSRRWTARASMPIPRR